MRGITIIYNGEEIHTGDDLDLVQEVKEIGKPKPQTYSVQIPGRNGLLNLTKGLTGKTTYYNRSLKFQFFGTGKRENLLDLDAAFSRYHGQTILIIDDDYPDHYYEGEATVSTVFRGNYITITLTVDAQPFRLKKDRTVYSQTVEGVGSVTLHNESVDAVPRITWTNNVPSDANSTDITIQFNGVSVTISPGTYEIEGFVLSRGANNIELSGYGTVTFDYQEGAI